MKKAKCVQFMLYGEFGHKLTMHRKLTCREIAENKIAKEDIPEGCIGYSFFTMNSNGDKENFLPAVYFGSVVSFEDMRDFLKENSNTELNEQIKDKKILISNLGSIELIEPWDSVINF